MTKRNLAQQMLDKPLLPRGFKRRGSRWTRETDDVIQSLELQQSQYGEQFYINIGLWLKPLGTAAKLQEKDMHVRLRADGVLQSIHRERLTEALDFDREILDSQRQSIVGQIVEAYVVPELEAWRSVDGVRKALAAGDLNDALVRREARALLSG